jgi:hypothetical protein
MNVSTILEQIDEEISRLKIFSNTPDRACGLRGITHRLLMYLTIRCGAHKGSFVPLTAL